MKCPNCLITMECISEIHDVPGQPGRKRMDLHCTQPKGNNRRNCFAVSHMGVITEDPKTWICHEYNFSINWSLNSRSSKTWRLKGYDYLVDPIHQRRSYEAKTKLIDYFGKEVITVDFIPISTGDDMHEDVLRVFNKLQELVIFS